MSNKKMAEPVVVTPYTFAQFAGQTRLAKVNGKKVKYPPFQAHQEHMINRGYMPISAFAMKGPGGQEFGCIMWVLDEEAFVEEPEQTSQEGGEVHELEQSPEGGAAEVDTRAG